MTALGRRVGQAVDRVETAVYCVPTPEPESDGTLRWDHTTVVTVHVSAAGTTGLGFTYGPGACAAVIDVVLADSILGCDALNVTGAWMSMVRAIRNAGRPGIVSMAIAAVDVALWDLKAKLLRLPLVQLLGQCRAGVAIYGSGGFTSLTCAQLADQVGTWVGQQGIPRVKMKIAADRGADPQRDLDRVAVARQAIGPTAELFVDANGGYTRKQAVRIARSLSDLGVTWFEEPVSSDDLDGLREIRALVDCDVAAGEYGYDLAYFQRMCAAEAVDVVQADVSRCAGITEWVRIAAVAAGYGLEISGHCAQSLHAHVACAVANCRHLEYFADHERVDRLLFDGVLEPRDGVLTPDVDREGHGLHVKSDRADRFRLRFGG